MNYIFTSLKTFTLILIILTGCLNHSYAQKLLNKQISVTANRQPVSEVLKTIGGQGGFYFSYDSNIVPGDSIVTLNVEGKPVREILDVLLTGRFKYKETGEYIILQRAQAEKLFYISGQIFDLETGKPVDYASVYSRVSLASALSNDDGSFRLKLKERQFPFILSVSKIGYADTSIVLQSELREDLKINITPRAIDLDEVSVYTSAGDRTWLARLFVSSRMRAQSRNIGRFFVSLPYQASLTPGLGTHGRMSSQVVNKVSLNLLGGYTAGVNGVEIAGGFNISKKDVRFVQLAGIFNIVSKTVNGVQAAGLYNQVLDSLSGVQLAGFGNVTGKDAAGIQIAGFFNRSSPLHGIQLAGAGNLAGNNSEGVQISGLVNRVSDVFHGVQIVGALNLVRKNMSGLQIAGVGNVGRKAVRGLQLGLFNYAKNLRGTQIGIINVADSSSGYSVGIINIIKHGKSNISVFSNEIVPFNIAWKPGSRKFYTILTAGCTINQNKKAYVFGFGIGKDFRLNDRLGFITEITNQNVYTGNWENAPIINRLQTALNLKLSKRLSLNAGPSFTIMTPKQSEIQKDYQVFPPKSYASFDLGNKASSWLGWQAGLSWQYGDIL